MAKIKQKTKSSWKKRLKVTKSGQLKAKHAYTSHNRQHRKTKAKRQGRRALYLKKSDMKLVYRAIKVA